MIQPTRIFLFDIDGVLVHPGGYRAAVRATLGYFLHQMGLPSTMPDGFVESLLPGEGVMARFEANRITSEWDMAPISLAIILEAVFEKVPVQVPGGSLAEVLAAVKAALPGRAGFGLDFSHLPYNSTIDRIGSALLPGEIPSQTALRLSNPPAQGSLFPHLQTPLLEELFSATRDWERSTITRIFQHFTLGSAAFQICYRKPAELEAPSLLGLYDTPFLTPELTQALIQAESAGEVHLAAYTLRASLPPREIPVNLPGFSPEADYALGMCKLLHIPLIGYGRLDYLAQITGEDITRYLKPSPIQAVAAILAALTHNELDAVIQAREFVFDNILPVHLSPFKATGLEVHVFEDFSGRDRSCEECGGIVGPGWYPGGNVRLGHQCGPRQTARPGAGYKSYLCDLHGSCASCPGSNPPAVHGVISGIRLD